MTVVDPLTVLREARVHQAGYIIDTTRGNWLRCADCGGEWEEDDDGHHIQGDMSCLPADVRAALAAVRKYGGVLKHPAYTLAWGTFHLHRPARGYWSRSLFDEGWVTEVSQSAYGHPARKRTWLYYVGVNLPPALNWRDVEGEGVVGAGIHSGQAAGRPRIDGHAASATPETFRDALIEMAETSAQVAA